jgi:hypothetical protein
LFWHRNNPAQFLAQRECIQDVEYAIFAFRIHARGPVRIACLVVTSVLLFAYLVYAFYELRSLYGLYRRGTNQADKLDSGAAWGPNIPMLARTPISKPIPMDPATDNPDSRALNEPYILAMSSYNTSSHSLMPISHSSSSADILGHLPTEEKSYSREEMRRRCGPLDPFLSFIVICYCTTFAYLIASTEAMLFHNPNLDNGAREWGFGQVRSVCSYLRCHLLTITHAVRYLR